MNPLRKFTYQCFKQKFKDLRVSLKIILLLLLLFIVTATGGSLALDQLKIFTHDAFAINHLGLIRGSIQKAVKSELMNINADNVLDDVDEYFTLVEARYLNNTISSYLVSNNLDPKIEDLKLAWQHLKETIYHYRADKRYSMELYHKSELCWELANFITYNAQLSSERKLLEYKKVILYIAMIVSVIIFFIILIVHRIVRNSLEIDIITDSMTKLYNRGYFNKILEEQIRLSQRYDDYQFSLILYDIDHFKNVNDDFGHQKGDEVLIKLSDILKKNAREVDYVFRLGGEEFASILPQTMTEQATIIAEKYRSLVASTSFSINRPLTISAGVGEYVTDEKAEAMFIRIDNALYQSKEQGRNRVTSV